MIVARVFVDGLGHPSCVIDLGDDTLRRREHCDATVVDGGSDRWATTSGRQLDR